MAYILSYDLGTGGTKASLFDEDGTSLADAFIPCNTYYPAPGFHEQKPEDWWNMVVQSTRKLLADTVVDKSEIVCLAVSGHSLGMVPVDSDGRCLTEFSPIWSDNRASQQAARFFETIDEREWYMTTGNGFPAPLYAIFKIMWVRDHLPEVYKNASCFLGTKDFVNLKMTGVMATDNSYASGSGVYDLRKNTYRADFIAAAGVDARKLPDIYPSSHLLGTLTSEAADALGLPQSTKVALGGVDNACMALGASCTCDGDVYTSLGSSAWIAVTSHTPIVDANKRPYVFAHCIPGMYTSATSIFSAGNTFRWLKNTFFPQLGPEASSKGLDPYDMLTAMAERAPIGANRLFCVPSLAGGSGLDKSSNIVGALTGLTLGHTADDVVRATLEGICMSLRLAMDVLEAISPLSSDMLIVGGGGKSHFWRELFANIYNKRIIETNIGQNAGSLGAAAVAAMGAGLWPDYGTVKRIHQNRGVIVPIPEVNAQYERLLPVFQKICDIQCDVGDIIHEI